jgi:hypothetical protein
MRDGQERRRINRKGHEGALLLLPLETFSIRWAGKGCQTPVCHGLTSDMFRTKSTAGAELRRITAPHLCEGSALSPPHPLVSDECITIRLTAR